MVSLLPDLTATLALILTAAGLATFVLGSLRRRELVRCLPLSLEFWVAAGLLRLSENPDWKAIGGAAALLAVRKVVLAALSV